MNEVGNIVYKMYGLCARSLSPMQKGIQLTHAIVEYGERFRDESYIKWANLDKTICLLCGGSTNSNPEKPGTMNVYMHELALMHVKRSGFTEEDMGDQLTAFVFLVPDLVWDKAKYPDFQFVESQTDRTNPIFLNESEREDWERWISSIGGYQNNKLREFLRPLKIAT